MSVSWLKCWSLSETPWFVSLLRHFEEKAEELEELKGELQGQIEELEEESDHLKRQQLMDSEAKIKLRQEISRLTAENMVCVDQLWWMHVLSGWKTN